MANEMFTQLPTVANASMSDIVCAVQGYVSSSVPGTSVQETLQQVYNLFSNNLISSYTGNPNGNVAGNVYQLVWDSTDSQLWVCITSGTTSTAVWVKAITLTGGTGISIAQSGGTITISSSFVDIGWTSVTGTSAVMVTNRGYQANNAGLVTLTLPSTSSFGDELYVAGFGAGGWKIILNTGQNIQVGSVNTTVTTGSVASTNAFDSINLFCSVANTSWQALGAPQGNLTIV
jgi:hypothetical protein